MKRLSTRLVIGTTIATSFVFAVALTGVAWFLTDRLVELRDRELLRLLRSNAATVFREHTRRTTNRPWKQLPPVRPDDVGAGTARSEFYLQAWNADGETILRQGQLGSADLPRLAEDRDAVRIRDLSTAEAGFADVTLPNEAPGRGAGLRFKVPDRSRGGRWADAFVDLELVVALDDDGLDRTIARLIGLLALGWVVASLTGAFILSWLTRRGLRPLHTLVDQIESEEDIGAGHAIALPNPPAELQPVVNRLNAYVARLRTALTQERVFASSAAHELRTPVAGLRATLEVALRRRRDVAEHEDAAKRCLAIVVELEALIESLLQLARGAETRLHVSDVAIDELLADCWAPFQAGARARNVGLHSQVEPGLGLRADTVMLRRVVANALANASEYADPDSDIDLLARSDDTRVVLEITNAASGDSHRPANGSHLGIGLDLSRRMLEALGGDLETTHDAGRFRWIAHIPNAPGAAAGAGPLSRE